MFRNHQTTESDPDPAIPIPMEDASLHTDTAPFCYDPTCGCHEEDLSIVLVQRHVQDGLFTPEEASAFVAGHSLWAAGSGEEASR